LAQKKQRYRAYLQSTIYKTYEMPNLLAFAKYVLHHVETLLMVIAIVMVIVLTIIVVIIWSWSSSLSSPSSSSMGVGRWPSFGTSSGTTRMKQYLIGNKCNKMHMSQQFRNEVLT
jgi:hypothetical protein